MIKAVSESSPEVGSSKMMTSGSLIISKAIEVLFLYPPEIPFIMWSPTKVSLQLSNLSSFIKLFTIYFLYLYGTESFNAATYYKVSRTVKVPNKTSFCIT